MIVGTSIGQALDNPIHLTGTFVSVRLTTCFAIAPNHLHPNHSVQSKFHNGLHLSSNLPSLYSKQVELALN